MQSPCWLRILVWLCGLVSVVSAQTLMDPVLRVTELVGGLSQPTSMAFIGPGDILVLQKADGRVRRVTNGALHSGEVLDVAVHSSSERGLLGIAVHPDFPTTPFVYLYYTREQYRSGHERPCNNSGREPRVSLLLERQRFGQSAAHSRFASNARSKS